MIVWATPGQLVAYIGPANHIVDQDGNTVPSPQPGCVYTILEVNCADDSDEWVTLGGKMPGVCIQLVEVPAPDTVWWSILMFRPVKPTSIEPIKALLRPTQDRVRA